MSSRTASISEQNCNNLLPFVCAKGKQAFELIIKVKRKYLGIQTYEVPWFWRYEIAGVIIMLSTIALLILLLALCAGKKARNKRNNFPKKKEFLRDSIRRSKELKNKLENAYQMESAEVKKNAKPDGM